MDLVTTLAEIADLSIVDRLRLVDAIWDSIIAEADETAMPKSSNDRASSMSKRMAGSV